LIKHQFLGVGAAWKTANVEPGSTVAIFGLGCIGLAVWILLSLCFLLYFELVWNDLFEFIYRYKQLWDYLKELM